MNRIIEFDHDIGDTVLLIPLEITARVDALRKDSTGEQYGVIYWNDGSRFSTWVYGWEIKKA